MAAGEAAAFAELKAALGRENYARVVEICNKIRGRIPEDPDAINIKCVALIRMEKFDKALDLAAKYDYLVSERLYCLYRLRKDDEALALLPPSLLEDPSVSPALMHVAAQLHFRRGHFDQCIALYEHLLAQAKPGEDVMEAQANLLAAYASAGRIRELTEREIPTDESFEVAFNKSFVAIENRDWEQAEALLQDAQRLCQEALQADGMTEQEIAAADETALIATQLAFVKQMRGDMDGALADYRMVLKRKLSNQAIGAVAANNIVSIRKDRDLFDSLKRLKAMDTILSSDKLMPAQQEAILANRTLILCMMNKMEECRESLQALQKAFPQSSLLFTLIVLVASKEQNQDRAVELLQQNKSLGGRLGLAHLYLSQGKVAQAAKTLAAIDEIAHTPGTVATLIALYEATGDVTAAQDVLTRALEHHRKLDFASAQALKLREGDARHKIAKREFEAAAQAYTELMEGANAGALDPQLRLQALASLVVALSYSDAEAAEQRCALLPAVEPSDADVEQLLEHQAQRSRRVAAALATADDKKTERKRAAKNPERIARKRAKHREAHLEHLRSRPDYNASIGLINPDPERWIPRKQRSYARRGRRGRNRFVGAQGAGAGTEKDAAKLDAAARAAKQAEMPEEKKGVVVTSGSSAVLRKSKKKKRR